MGKFQSEEKNRLYSLAEVSLKQAILTMPNDFNILSSYAQLQRYLQNHDAAAMYFQEAIKDNPKSARVLSQYAWFLQVNLQNFDEAEKMYLASLEIDPTHPRTLGDYAYFLYAIRKNFEKADELFQVK